MSALNLSVSIVIYDLDSSLFQRVLRSLQASVKSAEAAGEINNFRLTIIDNGSNDTTLSSLIPSGTDLVQNDKNLGFGKAHNQALLTSDADIHLILNPDVILSENTISEAIRHFSENTDTVACGPLGTDDDGTNLHLCKRYPTVMDLFLRGFMPQAISDRFRNRLDRYEYRDLKATQAHEVILLSGCCLFVQTQTARDVGGFDPNYFLYFEDYDLSLRLAEQGKIRYVPQVRIIHHGGNSARKGLKHILMFCRSAGRFFQKHGWKFA